MNMKALNQLKVGVVRALELLLILLVASLVLDVLWQVFSRYVLRSPSSWTDELATLLIIWVAMTGSSIAFIRHHHLGVDFLTSRLSPPSRNFCEILVQLLTAIFAGAVLILGGFKLVMLTLNTDQLSPALGIRMGLVYSVLPLSGVAIFISSLGTAFQKIRHIRTDDTTTPASDQEDKS